MTKKPLPCLHLGPVVNRARCGCPRKHEYRCEAGLGENGLATPSKHCGQGRCPAYVPDDPTEPVEPERPKIDTNPGESNDRS